VIVQQNQQPSQAPLPAQGDGNDRADPIAKMLKEEIQAAKLRELEAKKVRAENEAALQRVLEISKEKTMSLALCQKIDNLLASALEEKLLPDCLEIDSIYINKAYLAILHFLLGIHKFKEVTLKNITTNDQKLAENLFMGSWYYDMAYTVSQQALSGIAANNDFTGTIVLS
jgi:hypothetical protein